MDHNSVAEYVQRCMELECATRAVGEAEDARRRAQSAKKEAEKALCCVVGPAIWRKAFTVENKIVLVEWIGDRPGQSRRDIEVTIMLANVP